MNILGKLFETLLDTNKGGIKNIIYLRVLLIKFLKEFQVVELKLIYILNMENLQKL